MYPENLVAPMRADLVNANFTQLTTAEAAKTALTDATGVSLLVFNSVCGCAAGTARPGVKLALQRAETKPDNLFTVFAGVDIAATETARGFTLPYPPSSPSIAVFKNGELVHFVERHLIEGRSADMIADHLTAVFDEFCTEVA